MNKKEAKEIAIQIRYLLFAPEEEIVDCQIEGINNFMIDLLLKCENVLGRKLKPEEYEHSELGRRLRQR